MPGTKIIRTLFRLRRVARFSLRTSLIATTVIAVWLSVHVHSVRQQQAAIEVIQRIQT